MHVFGQRTDSDEACHASAKEGQEAKYGQEEPYTAGVSRTRVHDLLVQEDLHVLNGYGWRFAAGLH